MIAISVSIRQHEPILHGRQIGDYSRNQVASSKILGAMATKMVATWRVENECKICFLEGGVGLKKIKV